MTVRQEIHKALAELVKQAQAEGMQINTDWVEGCPPCNTIDDEDSCFGCPYRLRDNGVDTSEF